MAGPVQIMSGKPPAEAPRCDICLQQAGKPEEGLTLRACSKCGVYVHEACYVIGGSVTSKDWQCMPCSAVGSEVVGWSMTTQQVETAFVSSRPRECALCAVTTGDHAMHPLYHDSGEAGRQLILPGSTRYSIPPRLGWVHTVCAYGICNYGRTAGCVYGADKMGRTNDAMTCLDHFVMCGFMEGRDGESKHVATLQSHREELRCYICGETRKSAGRNLRIPIQCCAGGVEEHESLAMYHQDEEPCLEAFHVGCAMWGSDGQPHNPRRVWFAPASELRAEPIFQVLCNKHSYQTGANATNLKRTAEEMGPGSTILKIVPEELDASRIDTFSSTPTPTQKTPRKKKARKTTPHKKSTPTTLQKVAGASLTSPHVSTSNVFFGSNSGANGVDVPVSTPTSRRNGVVARSRGSARRNAVRLSTYMEKVGPGETCCLD